MDTAVPGAAKPHFKEREWSPLAARATGAAHRFLNSALRSVTTLRTGTVRAPKWPGLVLGRQSKDWRDSITDSENRRALPRTKRRFGKRSVGHCFSVSVLIRGLAKSFQLGRLSPFAGIFRIGKQGLKSG
jgi:hypothetical protein